MTVAALCGVIIVGTWVNIAYEQSSTARPIMQKGEIVMRIDVWIAVLLGAVLSFVIGNIYGQPLHWYLFILIIFVGFLINTIILILKMNDENV